MVEEFLVVHNGNLARAHSNHYHYQGCGCEPTCDRRTLVVKYAGTFLNLFGSLFPRQPAKNKWASIEPNIDFESFGFGTNQLLNRGFSRAFQTQEEAHEAEPDDAAGAPPAENYQQENASRVHNVKAEFSSSDVRLWSIFLSIADVPQARLVQYLSHCDTTDTSAIPGQQPIVYDLISETGPLSHYQSELGRCLRQTEFTGFHNAWDDHSGLPAQCTHGIDSGLFCLGDPDIRSCTA